MHTDKREKSETDVSSNSTPRSQSFSDDEVSTDYKSDTSDYNDEFDSIESKKEKEEEENSKFNLTKSIVRTLSGKLKSKDKLDNVNTLSIPISDRIHKQIRKGIQPSKLAKIVKKTKHIDQVDERGQSMLHLCSSLPGLSEHLKLVIKKGGNVNLQDNTGFTPLFCSVLGNNLEASLILLQNKNINTRITNNEKSNVLHYLARLHVTDQNILYYRKVLDLLIEKGIDINKINRQGETPLHSACLKVNIPAVAFLIERGANCNIQTMFVFSTFSTPLDNYDNYDDVVMVRRMVMIAMVMSLAQRRECADKRGNREEREERREKRGRRGVILEYFHLFLIKSNFLGMQLIIFFQIGREKRRYITQRDREIANYFEF